MSLAKADLASSDAVPAEEVSLHRSTPKFPDEIESEQHLAEHTDCLARRLESHLAKSELQHGSPAGNAEDDDCMPQTLEAMTAWKRGKDTQLGLALQDAIVIAEMAKVEGNQHFQKGSYQEAYSEYKVGIDRLEGFSSNTLGSDARKLCVTLFSNAAQALLKTGIEGASSEGACEMANKALALDPTNMKALFRRGCAYANGGDWNLARDDLKHVLRLEPQNASAKSELRQLKAREAAEMAKSSATPKTKQAKE